MVDEHECDRCFVLTFRGIHHLREYCQPQLFDHKVKLPPSYGNPFPSSLCFRHSTILPSQHGHKASSLPHKQVMRLPISVIFSQRRGIKEQAKKWRAPQLLSDKLLVQVHKSTCVMGETWYQSGKRMGYQEGNRHFLSVVFTGHIPTDRKRPIWSMRT